MREAETEQLAAEGAGSDGEAKVTPLELFFDLVFVFAFTQVTFLMAEKPTWTGLGEGMLVLAAVWWAWGGYAWLTNALHSDDGLARFGLLSAMAAMLIAALAVPEAFGDDAVIFGVAYFAVRAIHIAVYTYGAPAVDVRDAIVNLAPGLLLAPALLIVAGHARRRRPSRALDRRPADRLRHPLPARRRGLPGLRLPLRRALRADRDHRARRVDRRPRRRPQRPQRAA